jgi:hypothetical protein
MDKARSGIDGRRPDLVEGLVGGPLAESHLDRLQRLRKAQRLGERTDGPRSGLTRGLPLTIDAREPAGVDHLLCRQIDDLEEVLAHIGVVDQLGPASRPGAFDTHLVDRHILHRGVTGVIEVHPHGGTGKEVGKLERRGCGRSADGHHATKKADYEPMSHVIPSSGQQYPKMEPRALPMGVSGDQLVGRP